MTDILNEWTWIALNRRRPSAGHKMVKASTYVEAVRLAGNAWSKGDEAVSENHLWVEVQREGDSLQDIVERARKAIAERAKARLSSKKGRAA